MKSMPLFKVTGANGVTAKQDGAPGTSSSLPRLIKYVCYYNCIVLSPRHPQPQLKLSG